MHAVSNIQEQKKSPIDDRGVEPPPSRQDLMWRIAKHAAAVALMLSVLFHVFGWIFANFIFIGGGSGAGGAGRESTPVEFAVMSEAALAEIDGADKLEPDAPGVADSLISEQTPVELLSTPIGEDLSAMPGLGTGGGLSGGGDVTSDGIGAGGIGGAGGGGGASFFGIEAKGNRFVYIVDVSGSMSVGGKIEALKSQILESVNGLLESSHFLIILFSSDSKPLGGRAEWVEAGAAGKRFARLHLLPVIADGGTEPMNGFEMAFAMRPRADAIYFMTDGEFGEDPSDKIAYMNRSLKVPIHCICFVSNAGEETMKKIARQSKGTYTFVKGP